MDVHRAISRQRAGRHHRCARRRNHRVRRREMPWCRRFAYRCLTGSIVRLVQHVTADQGAYSRWQRTWRAGVRKSDRCIRRVGHWRGSCVRVPIHHRWHRHSDTATERTVYGPWHQGCLSGKLEETLRQQPLTCSPISLKRSWRVYWIEWRHSVPVSVVHQSRLPVGCFWRLLKRNDIDVITSGAAYPAVMTMTALHTGVLLVPTNSSMSLVASFTTMGCRTAPMTLADAGIMSKSCYTHQTLMEREPTMKIVSCAKRFLPTSCLKSLWLKITITDRLLLFASNNYLWWSTS